MSGLQLVCLWPGLAAAWYRGAVRSLCVAVLCAWAICLLLLATFVWPQWMALGLVRLCWFMATLVWLANAVWSHWKLRELLQSGSREGSRQFEVAQIEYLKGNWFEAEAVLMDVIHAHPRDAEAILLLVSVLRHTKRWQPALRRLNQLKLLDTAASWRFEIEQEERWIQQRMAEHSDAEAGVELAAIAEVETLPDEKHGEGDHEEPAATSTEAAPSVSVSV